MMTFLKGWPFTPYDFPQNEPLTGGDTGGGGSPG